MRAKVSSPARVLKPPAQLAFCQTQDPQRPGWRGLLRYFEGDRPSPRAHVYVQPWKAQTPTLRRYAPAHTWFGCDRTAVPGCSGRRNYRDGCGLSRQFQLSQRYENLWSAFRVASFPTRSWAHTPVSYTHLTLPTIY